MAKISILETPYEAFLRTRAEEVCQLYLGWSHEIMTGKVKPNRVIQNIAQAKSMSGEGVKSILKRFGVYKNAQEPMIIKRSESKQLSVFGPEQSALARM